LWNTPGRWFSHMHGLERWMQQAKTPLSRRPTQGPLSGLQLLDTAWCDRRRAHILPCQHKVRRRGRVAEEHSDCRARKRPSDLPLPLQNEAGSSVPLRLLFSSVSDSVPSRAVRPGRFRCVPRWCVLSTTLRTRSPRVGQSRTSATTTLLRHFHRVPACTTPLSVQNGAATSAHH
jgi:hypothetical protein